MSVRLLMRSLARSLRYVGHAVSTRGGSGALSFPQAAQAGDVAILAGSSDAVGSTPAGWTAIASGATLNYYRVCTGGETSVARPHAGASSIYAVLLLRPSGGGLVSLGYGNTASPAAAMTPGAVSAPSVAVVIGSIATPATWAPSLPAGYTELVNLSATNALYVALLPIAAGQAPGPLNIGPSSVRLTVGIFGVS